MAQGFKKSSRPKAVPRSDRGKQAPKRGARVIKPKKHTAIQAQLVQKRLVKEHIKRTEESTASRVQNPAGSKGLSLFKAHQAGREKGNGKGKGKEKKDDPSKSNK